ncbi:MAG: zinc-dependent peptidase [Bacteroidota bacterium]|nr:zinc-dependent peptidase [Bacteroidota bacterium]
MSVVIVFFIFYKKPKKKINLPVNYKELLAGHVAYYRNLTDENKTRFEEKIKDFLGYVLIDGIKTTVDDLDRLLVASCAVIPVFGFPEWRYYNLHDVLLYPETFNKDEFLAKGHEKNTLGMVGNGAMQRIMILSKPALHHGFDNPGGKENTGIHEFVHLLDKEDGDVDGLPEALLKRKYNAAWLSLIEKNIEAILEGHSDINSYGATNKAEFFAVASEYFFTNSHQFKENHRELYEFMTKIFNQDPAVN